MVFFLVSRSRKVVTDELVTLMSWDSDNKSRGKFNVHGTNQHQQYLLFHVFC